MERADFSTLRILLLSDKSHVALTMRSVLQLTGITRITGVDDSLRAIELLTMDHFEAVFCSESSEAVQDLSFPMAVRRVAGVIDPLMPVFVFQENARRRQVEAARDTGATDFLTCPVSPRTVKAKLEAAILNPRPFIKAPDYFGPDRRAKARPAWHGEERRSRVARKVRIAKPKPGSETVLI